VAPKIPSPTWRSLLHNHLTDTVAIDMFMVASATFRILYTLIVLNHDRRKTIHFGVTSHKYGLPTRLRRPFLGNRTSVSVPRPARVVRARFRIKRVGLEEVVIAPRSPWQKAYVDRIIGSIRHECLDHIIIFDATHLRRVLSCYFRYYHWSRTHLSPYKDCPDPRRIQLPSAGTIVAFPGVGRLHHRY
jgi:putative transposase